MTDEVLGSLLEKLADRLVERIVEGVVRKLQGAGNGFIDQMASLGPRRHIEAIRSGKLPGAIVGRQYIARAADVDAFVRNSPSECVADVIDAICVRPWESHLDSADSKPNEALDKLAHCLALATASANVRTATDAPTLKALRGAESYHAQLGTRPAICRNMRERSKPFRDWERQ